MVRGLDDHTEGSGFKSVAGHILVKYPSLPTGMGKLPSYFKKEWVSARKDNQKNG